MILQLDLGNSRAKWRLVDGDGRVEQGELDPVGVESGLRGLPWPLIEQTQLVSVADRSLTAAIAILCDSFSAPLADVCEVNLATLPSWFSLGGTDPAQIGPDRVMAMLGAQDPSAPDQAYCVIDAGTAVTVDFVTEGIHQGGYIVPGLGLSRRVLGQETARIGAVRGDLYSGLLEPGSVTQQAVEHGIRRQIIAFCDAVMRAPPFPLDRVCLTGGDADWILGHLSQEATVVSDLVFEGMAKYFRETG